jgi:hypothetical protein
LVEEVVAEAAQATTDQVIILAEPEPPVRVIMVALVFIQVAPVVLQVAVAEPEL